MTETNQNLLGLAGLSRELRLPAQWLKQKAISGDIPCLRVGRRLLFNFTAVESALATIAAKNKPKPHRPILGGRQ